MKKYVGIALIFGLMLAALAAVANPTSVVIETRFGYIRIYDVLTPAGHQCTIASSEADSSALAMQCYK